ncbi:DivIVA [Pontimonas salivibrio]|jgi:DivIVA domain-containing protein|uniref:Cell wall synthesis protein Wag31 n=1 Tax=Pontimonas salivibrio TaxID=1159327 RepID=A0A2L2BQK9_9MICO|nr:DivIVA domain-containing protein [Pontimonas salivibrio]AVG23956.1 DivIVA [Pontimonas salivibrio]
MALTPEDIVNKRFQATKFREGYDPDEVDDFLDEVVVEMRRLTEENEGLKKELEEAKQRAASVQSAPAPVPAASVEAPTISADDPIDAEGTTNLLQLARRLHEEHVREGIHKRDELIAEGHAQAARIVAEAEEEQKRRMAVFQQERDALGAKVDSLREFERQYRQGLRGFIESQLSTLEHSGVESSMTQSAVAAPPPNTPSQ